jgi:hypothetical protein
MQTRGEQNGSDFAAVLFQTRACLLEHARLSRRGHLRQTLAALLFHDTDLEAARAERSWSAVKTEPSATVKR